MALELHGGTLTDEPASAVALLEAAEGARTYWQPPQGAPDDVALAGLRDVLPWLAAVHVFSWWPRAERHPLAARADLWRAALALAGDVDALLEFVPGRRPRGAGAGGGDAEGARWLRPRVALTMSAVARARLFTPRVARAPARDRGRRSRASATPSCC